MPLVCGTVLQQPLTACTPQRTRLLSAFLGSWRPGPECGGVGSPSHLASQPHPCTTGSCPQPSGVHRGQLQREDHAGPEEGLDHLEENSSSQVSSGGSQRALWTHMASYCGRWTHRHGQGFLGAITQGPQSAVGGTYYRETSLYPGKWRTPHATAQ